MYKCKVKMTYYNLTPGFSILPKIAFTLQTPNKWRSSVKVILLDKKREWR